MHNWSLKHRLLLEKSSLPFKESKYRGWEPWILGQCFSLKRNQPLSPLFRYIVLLVFAIYIILNNNYLFSHSQYLRIIYIFLFLITLFKVMCIFQALILFLTLIWRLPSCFDHLNFILSEIFIPRSNVLLIKKFHSSFVWKLFP